MKMMKSNKKKSLAIPMVGGVFAFLDLRLVLKNESWFLTVRRRKQRFWRSWLLYRRYFSYHKESETLFLLWFHRATTPVRIKKERKIKTFLLFFFRFDFATILSAATLLRVPLERDDMLLFIFQLSRITTRAANNHSVIYFWAEQMRVTKCREIFLFLLLVNQQLHLNSLKRSERMKSRKETNQKTENNTYQDFFIVNLFLFSQCLLEPVLSFSVKKIFEPNRKTPEQKKKKVFEKRNVKIEWMKKD